MEVTKAGPGQAVIGVVGGRAIMREEKEPRPTEIGLRLYPLEGPAEPGGYVTVIYNGPVQVRAGVSNGSIVAGARLTLSSDGGVRSLQTTEIDGIQIAESAPVVGIALAKPDDEGLVWVLLSPQ
jgi:hypothetical protein